MPLRGLQKKFKKESKNRFAVFVFKKKLPTFKKKLPVSTDFAGNSHKSMVFGAVRRPRKILRPFSAVSRCFPLILCFKTRQNIILRTTFKKQYRLFQSSSKKNSKKNPKTASRFSSSKKNSKPSKKNCASRNLYFFLNFFLKRYLKKTL